MSTVIRAELSKNNKYWIERHRYYELKHFCMQYPIWKKIYNSIDGLDKRQLNMVTSATGCKTDLTAKRAIEKAYYSDRINMIDRVAADAEPELAKYIIKGVTEGISYDHLKARLEIPCSKDMYYDCYRRFFWLLSKARD